ncbi:MAG: acyl transferase [Bacteroidia bacterium]|nr:acyl transferase [Bacteroidia bacterium]
MEIDQQKHKIFTIKEENFSAVALEIFNFQYNNNLVYKSYVDALGIDPTLVRSIQQIPFLPVSFFRSHDIQTTFFDPEIVFESSGTTRSINSRHLVKDLSVYEESFTKGFEFFYGPVNDFCIIGLLPSYLERKNSSLIYMVEKLINQSRHPQSGLYLNEHEKLFAVLKDLEIQQQQTLLIGVSFALLDLAEKFSVSLTHTIVMETGGMKGRRQEMIRPELHALLQKSFQVGDIHSEYGMTELLSQAYSKNQGVFNCPPWMKVLVRDEEDPLLVSEPGFGTVAPITGAINIIDLANIYSCSFISTDDVGKLYGDGSFEVLGRLDNSDLRGCSMMVL